MLCTRNTCIYVSCSFVFLFGFTKAQSTVNAGKVYPNLCVAYKDLPCVVQRTTLTGMCLHIYPRSNIPIPRTVSLSNCIYRKGVSYRTHIIHTYFSSIASHSVYEDLC